MATPNSNPPCPPRKRTVLITGCSDGSLGSALCLAFHRAGGWRVFASARNPAKLKQVEAAGIETVQLDTLSDESIAAAVARVSELLLLAAPPESGGGGGGGGGDGGGSGLDMLINNAGAGYAMPLLDVDLARARRLFDLNVFSPLAVTRAFLPLLMAKRPKPGSSSAGDDDGGVGGTVVNNTSCSSITTGGLPFAGAYNASKAALLSLTETLRLELAPFGVRVVNLVTGAVRSTFHENVRANADAPGSALLPPGSLYNVAKEAVEHAMSGADSQKNGDDPTEWADGVVRDLIGGGGMAMLTTRGSSASPRPPHWIWRGRYSTTVRITSLFPVGWFDRVLKNMVGLDVVERRLREQEAFKQS